MTRGWTPKNAIARSRRNIAAAIVKLRLVSVEWSDADCAIEREAEDLIRELAIFADNIEASIKDRLAAGEQVGI